MKQILLYILIAAVIVGCITPPQYTEEFPTIEPTQTDDSQMANNLPDISPTEEEGVYSNEDYGFTMDYPDGWNYAEGFMGSIVAFMSGSEQNDVFTENVNVIGQDISASPISLEEYTTISLSQFEQYLTNFSLISSEDIEIEGNPAHKVVYTAKQGQFSLKFMQIWTIFDNEVFLFTYTGELAHFDDYSSQASEIMDSFSLL